MKSEIVAVRITSLATLISNVGKGPGSRTSVYQFHIKKFVDLLSIAK